MIASFVIDVVPTIAGKAVWSAEEIAILRAHYPKGAAECAKLLRGRTINAIHGKAVSLGIRADNRRPAIERFYSQFEIVGHCWVWRGAKDRKGYGRFKSDDGSTVAVHRFAYERLRGAIAPGLVIDHLCRNPGCCNPDHLEAVTNAVNVQRGNRGALRVPPAECKRGHAYTAENARFDKYGKRSCRTCARENERKLYAARKAAS